MSGSMNCAWVWLSTLSRYRCSMVASATLRCFPQLHSAMMLNTCPGDLRMRARMSAMLPKTSMSLPSVRSICWIEPCCPLCLSCSVHRCVRGFIETGQPMVVACMVLCLAIQSASWFCCCLAWVVSNVYEGSRFSLAIMLSKLVPLDVICMTGGSSVPCTTFAPLSVKVIIVLWFVRCFLFSGFVFVAQVTRYEMLIPSMIVGTSWIGNAVA